MIQEMNTAKASWPMLTRIAFRFVFIYFLLWILPLNNVEGYVPALEDFQIQCWDWIVSFVAEKILHVVTPAKSQADTSWEFVRLFTIAVISLLGTVIWSIIDRKRKSYNRLQFFYFAFIRYYLAISLLVYGLAKVMKVQFPDPDMTNLMRPLGNLSPMGLLWSFMGYSKTYNLFTGTAEVLGSLLILYRRTTLLGALIIIAVMSNVVMLNFTYRVNVKIISCHLLFMSVLLVVPNIKRLANFFIFNRPTAVESEIILFKKPYQHRLYLVVKIIFIAYLLVFNIDRQIENQNKYGYGKPTSPLNGVYDTQLFVFNSDTLPPLTSDTTRWLQVSLYLQERATNGRIVVQYMNKQQRSFSLDLDTLKKEMLLTSRKDPNDKSILSYHHDTIGLVLTGRFKADSVLIKMDRFNLNKLRLLNSEFIWANADPILK